MNIIICGAGRVGFTIAKQLSEQGHSITVIDQSSDDIQKIDDSLDVKAIVGKATYPSILEKADATEADMIIAVTRNDEINMLICQIAFSIFKIPKKIPVFFLPIIAGTICGVTGIFFPELLGLGTDTIRFLIEKPNYLGYLTTLLLGKLFLTVLCIRLNLFGGIFSPALFLGVCTGSIFAILAGMFFEINHSLFAVAGLAAVTSTVIGGPIATLLIVFELTSDYNVALGAGISICFSNLISSKIFGHSAFDQILLNRNIDIHLGRDRLHLSSIKVIEIVNKKYIRLVPEHSVTEMIAILSNSNVSEGYIINPEGKLIGKVNLPELIKMDSKKSVINNSNFKKFIFLNSTDTILEAIDRIKNFVGESIPVKDNKGYIQGIISESDLFNALLVAEKERNEEELS